MKKFITISLLTISALVTTSLSLAEDIELYVSDEVRQSAKKSKVLIIFDNSGSMGTLHNVKEPFSKDKTYPPEGSSHAYNDDATYFNKGSSDGVSEIPNSPSDGRRFLAAINSCESSKEALRTYGTYTGRIREYTIRGNSGTWEEIPDNNGLNIELLEQIENYDRDFYTGVFGVFDGESLDSSVLIRFIQKDENGTISYKSGGGITCDSNVYNEYQELIDKIYLPF